MPVSSVTGAKRASRVLSRQANSPFILWTLLGFGLFRRGQVYQGWLAPDCRALVLKDIKTLVRDPVDNPSSIRVNPGRNQHW